MVGDVPRGVEKDDKGESHLPPERFKNYKEVMQCCQNMIDDDQQIRAPRRARVDGLINGNRPIRETYLKSKKLSFLPNVNFLESRGLIETMQTPLYDLVVETDHLMDIKLEVKGTKLERQSWENSIQNNITWLLLTRWRRGFNFHIPFQQFTMLKHGLGAHIWPTKRWIPRTPRSGSILFPSNAPINFDEDGEYFMIRDALPANALYQFIRNEKSAANNGWMVEAVWKSLAQSTKASRGRSSQGDIEEVQREIRRGDIGWFTQSRQAVVWLNYLFVKEIDTNMVSQYIVTESPSGDVGDYLYKKRNQFKEWPLVLFPYNIGDGDINSLQGLGDQTAMFFELSNRLKNAMAAQVMISMFPQIKQLQPDVDPDKLKLMRLGALSILPYGVEIAQTQFPPLNNGPIALTQELKRTMESNNQSMIGSTPEPKDRETALSFSMRSHDKARVSNGLQSLYESNLQQFDDRVLRMVLDTPKGDLPHQKMAEEFRDRCRKDGVPEAALKSRAIAEVREVTSVGAGSAGTRLQALMTLMNVLFPNTTKDKQITILRDLTGASVGSAKVDRYAPSLEDIQIPNYDDSMAAVESSALAQGQDAVVSGNQDNGKHADSHLAKAEEIMQAVQNGEMDPKAALKGLMKLLDHAGQHLTEMQNNATRKAEFEQLSERWDEVAKFTAQLQKEIQSEAEQQPATDADISRKDKVASADIQRKDRVAEANIARKFRQTAFTERLSDARTAAQINRSNGARRPVRA
jgi:hypothetical protein